jgi:glycosyltransferase involved in cell wall biosynthesis
MSCETPVVAFEVGGLAEQVTAETGWLVPPYETDRMARTIESALDDPATLSKYGSQGRQRVLDRYGFSNFVDEHVAIYRDEVEAAC